MSEKLNVAAKVEPPQTKLTEMLAIFQDLFNNYSSMQLMGNVEVLAKLIDEPKNIREILRFIDSYLFSATEEKSDGMTAFQKARDAMAVMCCLGYMYGVGEERAKHRLIK